MAPGGGLLSIFDSQIFQGKNGGEKEMGGGGEECQRTLHERTTRVLTIRNLENSVITLSTSLENQLHTKLRAGSSAWDSCGQNDSPELSVWAFIQEQQETWTAVHQFIKILASSCFLLPKNKGPDPLEHCYDRKAARSR